MAPQANLTENDRRILSEPYNPVYNLIPVAPVIVKQLRCSISHNSDVNANDNLGITAMTV